MIKLMYENKYINTRGNSISVDEQYPFKKNYSRSAALPRMLNRTPMSFNAALKGASLTRESTAGSGTQALDHGALPMGI